MLTIDSRIFERFPGLRVGTVVARGLDNRGSTAPLSPGLRDAEAAARRALTGALVEHPRIAPWREAYRAFGAKPKKYPSSIEALARRVLRGDPLPSISPLVDLYNTLSLRYLLPFGGEDLDKVQGRVELRFAGEAEPEVALLGRPEPASPEPGEVIYSDELGAICRRWNWREAAHTALAPETENAIFVIEALPPTPEDELRQALEALRDGLHEHCARDGDPGPGLHCELEVHAAPQG